MRHGVRAMKVATIVVLALIATHVWSSVGSYSQSNVTSVATPPDDCFIAPEASNGGPAAPTNLTDSLSNAQPFFQFDLLWEDRSDDETCFVVEADVTVGAKFEVIAVLPANTSAFHDPGPYGQGKSVVYRVYAASNTARSAYSNATLADVPIFEPNPTPTPMTPTATGTPAQTPTSTPKHPSDVSPTPESPSVTTIAGPSGFPATGGPGDGSSLIPQIHNLLAMAAAIVALLAGWIAVRALTRLR
jgi:hypothetical protein